MGFWEAILPAGDILEVEEQVDLDVCDELMIENVFSRNPACSLGP